MNFFVMLPVALLQALLVVPLDGRPVRFGVPLPAAVVAAGLGLEGHGVLQWRRLPIGGVDADPVWVELAIVGPPGTVRVVPGSLAPSPERRGAAFVYEVEQRKLPEGTETRECWHWCDGTVDERARTAFEIPTVVGDETYAAGEWRTVENGVGDRVAVVLRMARFGERIGLLPKHGGGGQATRRVREHLHQVLGSLHELPGARGAGDFLRSGGVVTNLEFDTTLALLRCALGCGDERALSMARRTAQHLRDRDWDARSGLPFPHGPDHRTGTPEIGHAWLQGLLWAGLLAADDFHIEAARNLARAIAATPPQGVGPSERLRDYAWPLGELEALLAVDPDVVVRRVADDYALSIARRFDPVARTFRFGEGEVGGGVYFERGWLTAGILLPALQAHLRRRADADLAEHVSIVRRALLERIGRGGPGLPTHWRLAGGKPFAEHREIHTAEAAFVLEGFEPADLRRLLTRASIADVVDETPCLDDPDLPTQFTMLARCQWVWR